MVLRPPCNTLASVIIRPIYRVPVDAYDWCTVPEQPWDVILFAGIAIVVSCVWQGSYQSLLVLISGEALH